MVVASATMWIFRIFCSVVLGKWMGLGVFGVWVANDIRLGIQRNPVCQTIHTREMAENGIDLNETD